MGSVPFVLRARPGASAGSAPASGLALITNKRWRIRVDSVHAQSVGSGRFQFSDSPRVNVGNLLLGVGCRVANLQTCGRGEHLVSPQI